MAKKKVCDFCLSEGGGLFNRLETLSDGHHMCKDCKKLIQKYNLPLKYDLFQQLVTAQANMKDMIIGLGFGFTIVVYIVRMAFFRIP